MTDPSDITAADRITDDAALELDGAHDIATFTSGGRTYAVVAAHEDDGVQMLDVTNPYNVTAVGSITDDAALGLYGASGIAVFESGGDTYAAVTAHFDNGVQILRLTGDGALQPTLNNQFVRETVDAQEAVTVDIGLSDLPPEVVVRNHPTLNSLRVHISNGTANSVYLNSAMNLTAIVEGAEDYSLPARRRHSDGRLFLGRPHRPAHHVGGRAAGAGPLDRPHKARHVPGRRRHHAPRGPGRTDPGFRRGRAERLLQRAGRRAAGRPGVRVW